MTVAPRGPRGRSSLPGRFQRAITSEFLQGEGPIGLNPWSNMTRIDLDADAVTHPKKDHLVVTDEGAVTPEEERQGMGDTGAAQTTQTGSYKTSLNPDLPLIIAQEI